MTKKILKEIASWILVFVIAFAISQFVTKVIILEVEIPSGSMEDTIMVGDRVIALRLAYASVIQSGEILLYFLFPMMRQKTTSNGLSDFLVTLWKGRLVTSISTVNAWQSLM